MQLLAILFKLFVDDAHADALVETAPTYLTREAARDHIASAFVAGIATNQRPALLLSIAWHESRYEQNVVSTEAGGLVSCGVMTPSPTTKCYATDLTSNYLVGAKHLNEWRDATRAEWTMLLGYGGGYRAIKTCASSKHYACAVPGVFLWRANLIERAWRKRLVVLV